MLAEVFRAGSICEEKKERKFRSTVSRAHERKTEQTNNAKQKQKETHKCKNKKKITSSSRKSSLINYEKITSAVSQAHRGKMEQTNAEQKQNKTDKSQK